MLELLADAGVSVPVLRLGIPDSFIEHGSRNDNLASAGLDAATMHERIAAFRAPLFQRA